MFLPVVLCGSVRASSAAWTPASLDGLLTDYWTSGVGMYQDSGATTPVTSVDQTIASWVGAKGTKLTTAGSGMRAVSVRGILTPVSISDQDTAWVLPGDFSLDRRDFVLWQHVQVGSGYTQAYAGIGDARGVELSTYTNIRFDAYNPAGGTRHPGSGAPLASPMVLGLDGGTSAVTVRRNADGWSTGTPYASGTAVGGYIGALYDGSIAGACIYHGLSITRALDSLNRGLLLSYYDSRVTRPSDTAPDLNIIAVGDSNTCGSQAGGASWPWLWVAADHSARIVSSSKSGQYFSAGGAPLNNSTNATRIDAQYLAGADRNIIIIADTNDFSSLDAATALSNREAWAASRKAQGWEVWQPYMPVRVSPYGSAAAYTAMVQSFNTLLAASTAFDRRPDLYTAFGGSSPPAGTFASDGVHWSAATQAIVYATLLTNL